VYRIAHLALGLGVVRATLAGMGFAAALAAGAERGPAALGLAFGAGVTATALLSDRRWTLGWQPELHPLPDGIEREGLKGAIAHGLLPSTAGVSVLLVIALAFEPLLAAVLAGVLAGMVIAGLAGLAELVMHEYRDRVLLYADATDSARRYAVPRA
jgi:hypothetical protein